MQRLLNELERDILDLADRIGRNPCCVLLTLVALDLLALWLGYKYLTQSLSGRWST